MSTATEERERTEAQQDPVAEEPKETQQLVRSAAANIGFGLSARNWDEGLRIARTLANSSLVPKAYQGKPEDVVVAMQYGAEIGLPPMASLQSVAVINGKPGVYGDGFLGVIMSKPAYLKHVEYYELADGTRVKSLRKQDYEHDDTKAVSMFWRKGNPEPFVGEFSIDDAKRAKLWTKEGPWTNYPARQLKWRARGFAGRDGFAAELRGVKMAEELLDTPEDEITVETVHTAPPEPVRRSEKQAGAGSTTAATPPAPARDQPTAPAPDLTNELPPDTPAKPAAAAASQPARPADPTPARQPRPAAAPPAKSTAAPPRKSTFPQTAPLVTTGGVLITDTSLVSPKGVAPYYEIKATLPGKSPTHFVFLTDDEGLYKMAASCEGSDSIFRVTWHGSKKYDGSACKVLTAIESAQ